MALPEDYVCEGQLSLFDIPMEPPQPIRCPCGKRCEVEWGSLSCFLKRGYIRHEGKWVRNDKGDVLRLKNRECDWEPREGEEVAKAPIWHSSLSASWVECPKCKEVNHIENWHTRCPDCGQLLDQSPEAIAKAEKVSKDLAECRKLGLHGAVTKDSKGKWIESR